MQRRRERINEKMKALQELIPHCNKVLAHNIQSPFSILSRFLMVIFCCNPGYLLCDLSDCFLQLY